MHPKFLSSVLFTDEATFGHDGVLNMLNLHVWSENNPHATDTSVYKVRFFVNVWIGVVGDCLIGPYLLPRPLNGRLYNKFFAIALPELLEDISLSKRQCM